MSYACCSHLLRNIHKKQVIYPGKNIANHKAHQPHFPSSLHLR